MMWRRISQSKKRRIKKLKKNNETLKKLHLNGNIPFNIFTATTQGIPGFPVFVCALITFPNAPSPKVLPKIKCSLGNSQALSTGSSYSEMLPPLLSSAATVDFCFSIFTTGISNGSWTFCAFTKFCFSTITFFVHWVTTAARAVSMASSFFIFSRFRRWKMYITTTTPTAKNMKRTAARTFTRICGFAVSGIPGSRAFSSRRDKIVRSIYLLLKYFSKTM